MSIKNDKLGGTDWDTPTVRIKPSDLNDTVDGILIGVDTSISFSYDGEGRIETVTEDKDGETWTTTITYDDADLVTEVVTNVDGKDITFTYSYDEDNNISSINKTITDES